MSVVRPLLPTADKLAPYLERLDKSRIYSNFGLLNAEYQERISELFGCPCITGSSATSLITATLMALGLPKGSLVAMPSWTFPATASAVVSAGMVPYFVDVIKDGEHEGIIDGGRLDLLANDKKVSAAIIVSPLGKPLCKNDVDITSWSAGIPIIVDAAAGFDSFSTISKPGKCPVIVSTHATKVFGTGEGGFISCHNADLLERIRRITNFGLTPDRRIEYNGLNAKFSEYHAAVGLAALDEWPEKRKKYLEQTKKYGLDYAVSQVAVRGGIGRKGVYGCHVHDAYKNYPRTALPVTEDLIENMRFVGVEI